MTKRIALSLLTVVMFIGLLLAQRPMLSAVAAGVTVMPAVAAEATDVPSGAEAAGSFEVTLETSPDDGGAPPANADDESEENDGSEQDEPFSVPVLPVTPKPNRLGWMHAVEHVVAEAYLPPPGSPPEARAARG